MSLIPAEFANQESATLRHAVLLHIIRVEDISVSKLNQIDEWKEISDPNNRFVDRLNKSTRIIRQINDEESESSSTVKSKQFSTYKLLLRDKDDHFIYAYELEPLKFVRNEQTSTPIPIKLGGRLLVKPGATISRGVLLLNHKNCEYKGIHASDAHLVSQLNDGLSTREIDILSSS
ncbi:hypothetical protein KGF57_000674 [Candida theae]|uniref:RecQ mediated genome instability protein 1 OB-fold domain-containing protein n=1 Tax=Candida theae TaxID=1198502 RepID=A0AAD5BII8_9ASCO|nr:uncharacterized protein KGF57_000674 [Candida theae]KAI5966028.1 hypothetical protein KGF57_000674 [Candida theae]